MFKFVDVTGYTTSKSSDPLILNGIFRVTDTSRCGRVKVENDESTYWINSDLDQTGITEISTSEIVDLCEDSKKEEDKNNEEKISSVSTETHKDTTPIAVHIVQRGETIQSIAEMYGVSAGTLINTCGTTNVYIGQIIYIF